MSALTPTQSGIAAEHPEIIEGLETIYGILIGSGYVQNTDVQVPPHGIPKEPVNVAGLRAIGLDPQTIELIGRLPCFTDDINTEHQQKSGSTDAIPIAPASSAISYLVGSDFSSGVRETDPGNGELLPGCALRIIRATSPQGYNVAYNLDTKEVIEWHPGQWHSRQCFPVQEYFQRWTSRLRSGEWTTCKDDSGWHVAQCSSRPDSVLQRGDGDKLGR